MQGKSKLAVLAALVADLFTSAREGFWEFVRSLKVGHFTEEELRGGYPTDQEVVDCILAVPAHYLIALVTSTAQSLGTNGGTTSGIDTTGANFLAVFVAYITGTTPTVSDSKSNTWTPLTARDTTIGAKGQFFYSKNPTVGTGHTFTVSGSSIFASIGVQAFSGVDPSSPFDAENGAINTTSTSLNTNNVSPGQANEVIVAGLAFDGTGTVSPTAGWTGDSQVALNGGVSYGLAVAHLIETTAASAGCTFSWSGIASTAAACVACFKIAGAGTISGFTDAAGTAITHVPSNHGAGTVVVKVVGAGTNFQSGDTWTASNSGGSWGSSVTKVVNSTTSVTLTISCPAAISPPAGATGTLTITNTTLSISNTLAVSTPTLAISPTSGTVGTTPSLSLTGAFTLWANETAAGLFTETGGTGDSIATPTGITNTGATAVLTAGSVAATLTITDSSTGATATFAALRAAAIYFIRNGGSDSNTGLINDNAHAWQTVGKVVGWSKVPGDQFKFHHLDTFTDATLVHNTSGTQALPIVYTSDDPGVLTSTIAPSSDIHGCSATDVSFVTIRNLNIVGPGFTGSTPSQVTTSTHAAIQVFSSQQGSSRLTNITIDNCICGGFRNGIMLLTRSATVSNNGSPYYTYNGSPATATVVGIDNISITNCVVNGAANNGILAIGGYPNVGSLWDATHDTFRGLYIFGCEVTNIYGFPVVSHGDPGAPNPVALINTTNAVIERCAVHDNGQGAGGGFSGSGPGGIVVGRCQNTRIAWCEVWNTVSYAGDGIGIDCDEDANYCLVFGNLTHNNAGAGYMNYSTGGGVQTGNVFAFNISYNDCISAGGDSLHCQGHNALWVNNTVYKYTVQTTACLANVFNNTTNLFINNIFIAAGSSFNLVNAGGGNIGDSLFLGNLYWNVGNAILIDGNTSLAAWQATGQEKLANGLLFGIVADPLLSGQGAFGAGAFTPLLPGAQVNTTTAFDPTGSSPAIGVGFNWFVNNVLSTLQVGMFDFHGYPNRVTANRSPDIGAVTYNGKSLVPNVSGGTNTILQSIIIQGLGAI
jgi:hypothetical protein